MAHPQRPTMLSLDEVLQRLLAVAHDRVLPEVEKVDTFDSLGRVLARSVVSALDVPPADNTSMDGYAMRAADVPATGTVLPVSQRLPAGVVGQPLQPGTAVRIFTGAQVPAGADAVVMQEQCSAVPGDGLGSVRIDAVPQPGQWVRRRGEDVLLGAEVLTPGTRITPQAMGLAASVGASRLTVRRKPRVALFSTGDELVMPGEVDPQDMRPGAIYNSNRFFLSALLHRLGCEVSDLGIVPDNRERTVAALKTAADHHDLILTSGGVSVGEEDHIKPAVQSLGSLDLWQIAIKPGKPFAYGRVGQAHFMGLPGNPVSSFITFQLLVRPFLLRLSGVTDVAIKSIASQAHFTWSRADKRREFLRVRRNAAGGLDLFPNQSSGVLTSTVWGDGVVDNPPGQAIAHGDTVRFIPMSEWLA
jgi:molybdopterin molybdotransferase